MTANKPSDAIPAVMKRRIQELERDGYNEDFLRCFRNAIRSLDETDRYAHANKVQAEEIKALAARLAESDDRAARLAVWLEESEARLAEAERLLDRAEDALLDQDSHAAFQTVLDDIDAFLRPADSASEQETPVND